MSGFNIPKKEVKNDGEITVDTQINQPKVPSKPQPKIVAPVDKFQIYNRDGELHNNVERAYLNYQQQCLASGEVRLRKNEWLSQMIEVGISQYL